MAALGDIGIEPPSEDRGPDLRIDVRVSARDLGRPGGVRIPVPEVLELDGERVERAVSAHDPKGALMLHLPDSLPEGAVIRLVGQGGRAEGRPPGDLWVGVTVERAVIPAWGWLAVAAAVAGALWGLYG